MDALAILRQRVRIEGGFDPQAQPRFTPRHAAMLRDVDGVTSLGELLAVWGRAGAESALAVMMDLLAWHACSIDGGPPRLRSQSDDIPIYQDEPSRPIA